MGYILLNIFTGLLLVPVLLFLAANLLAIYREKQGMDPIPPDKISLLIILGSLVSWVITGVNILIFLLGK